MSMSNDFQVLQTASRLVDYSGVADVTNLVEWSFCNAVEVHSEYSNVEYFVTRLRVGPPITVRSPRTFLSERLSGKTRVLQETEKSILAWSKYHHENVAEVFGIARFRDQIVIVTFGAEIVALPAYLTRNPSADKLRISLQITSGAVYLHSLGAVHHAVKASNVEVDSGGVAKLAGFDSFYNDLTTDYSTQSIETSLWWMAPEQLLGTQSHTIESNVYALGMTILEIFTGKRPYAEIPNFASLVRQLVSDRIFPRRPFWLTPGSSDTDNQLWQLLLNCWDRDPQARPATAYIQRQLDRLQQDYAALRPLSPTRVMIESSMSASDVITHLAAHQCPDVTSDLDLTQCEDNPSSGGGFSDVYQGRLLNGTKVAIKCLRLFSVATGYNHKVHKHAARELYAWSKFKHDNVLNQFGLALFRNQIAMVSSWMEYGSLVTYVAQNPKANLYDLCAQVAEGLAYVHSQEVIHGDVKGANVLISQDGIAKLTDFGCTVLKPDATVGFTQTGSHNFSLRWAAPELLTDENAASVASDVYALGMTILEVISGHVPYHDKRDTVVMHLVIFLKAVPKRPQQMIDDALWGMLKQTWSHVPENRPEIVEIRNTLVRLAKTR